MTSLFRELVSVPADPCFSISTVETDGSRDCSLRAMARPTTPPPITAWVKSAWRRAVEEKALEMGFGCLGMVREKARIVSILADEERVECEIRWKEVYENMGNAKTASK